MLDLGAIGLEEIANALTDQTDYERRWLLDRRKGQVAFWASDTGIDGEKPVDIDGGNGSLNARVKAHHDGVRLTTKQDTDVRVQQVQIAPGGRRGWHHHPGVVIVVVSSGSVTFWEDQCNKTDYGPGLHNGATFIESGDKPGQVTSAAGATTHATHIVPKQPSVFRVEDVAPACVAKG
jgi:quercetin dioxygenase-like cupin family protein